MPHPSAFAHALCLACRVLSSALRRLPPEGILRSPSNQGEAARPPPTHPSLLSPPILAALTGSLGGRGCTEQALTPNGPAAWVLAVSVCKRNKYRRRNLSLHGCPPTQGFPPLSFSVPWELSGSHFTTWRWMGLSPQPMGIPGGCLKLPEPSFTLDHLNRNAWGPGLDIDWILKAPHGDPNAQTGQEASPQCVFQRQKR